MFCNKSDSPVCVNLDLNTWGERVNIVLFFYFFRMHEFGRNWQNDK